MKKLICLLLLLALCAAAVAEEPAAPVDPRVQPAIALSFDDGPSKYTQQVLDLLAEYDCRATFFMVGSNMETMPELVKAVYESGNEVGLHSWKHSNLKEMADYQIQADLQRCQQIAEELTGTPAKWMRPPYGKISSAGYGACRAMNLCVVTWSLDSNDWELRNAEKIADRALKRLRNGDIILFHDIHAETVEALKTILPEIKARGYQVLTVDALMSLGESVSPGKYYSRLDMGSLPPLE